MRAMMDRERCRLLMRQMAWSKSSLARPSRCSSYSENSQLPACVQLTAARP